MVLAFAAFAAAIILIACAIFGGLYLVCRDTQHSDEQKAKKLLTSDFK